MWKKMARESKDNAPEANSEILRTKGFSIRFTKHAVARFARRRNCRDSGGCHRLDPPLVSGRKIRGECAQFLSQFAFVVIWRKRSLPRDDRWSLPPKSFPDAA
jgi:hypothetical protein